MKGVIFGQGFLGKRLADSLDYFLMPRNIDPALYPDLALAQLDYLKADIVINAIGKTGRPNIDWCEDHKRETIESNLIAAVNLALACSKREMYFVHLGSGCMYYGKKYFSEKDEPNFYGPQFYAKTKILAEKVLKEFPCLQLRLRMPIDDRPHERNLIDKLKKYSKLIDVQNSMTTVPHMIEALKTLIANKKLGIYNLVNPGTISAVEIMRMYKEIINPNHTFEIMSLEELDKVTKGKRSNCKLSTKKLKKEGIKLPEIHKAVKECLLSYKTYSEK